MKFQIIKTKLIMAIVLLLLYEVSYGCIIVEPKMIYPSEYCNWAEDYIKYSSYIGIVKIDSIVPMHRDEDYEDQHFTYKVYYSDSKNIFNSIGHNGVFVYQSLSICWQRTDIKFRIGMEYIVSLSLVSHIPYSQYYIGSSKDFFESKEKYLIMNRYADIDKLDEIKETVLDFNSQCIKVENKSYHLKSSELDTLE